MLRPVYVCTPVVMLPCKQVAPREVILANSECEIEM